MAEMGLGGAVRLSGHTSDGELVARYAAADVAVFLSEYEGFGLPVLEAMVRGVPVVASARPALGEIFGSAALLETVKADPRVGELLAGRRVLKEIAVPGRLVNFVLAD